MAELNLRQQRGVRVRSLDADALGDHAGARASARNIEVSAYQTFAVDSVPGAAGDGADRSLNSLHDADELLDGAPPPTGR